MSDSVDDLVKWAMVGRAMVAALPPIDEEAERMVAAAIAASSRRFVPRKLIKKRTP